MHGLRVLFRELARAEVAATVGDPQKAVVELRRLIAVAAGGCPMNWLQSQRVAGLFPVSGMGRQKKREIPKLGV
jgi:hypothetical protein